MGEDWLWFKTQGAKDNAVREALLDSLCCGAAMAPSRAAGGFCASNIAVIGTRQQKLRPTNDIQFQARDPKRILKKALPKGEERSEVTFLIWELAHPCKTKSQTNSFWKDLSRDWDRKCLETWYGLISVKLDLMVTVTTYFCGKKQSK